MLTVQPRSDSFVSASFEVATSPRSSFFTPELTGTSTNLFVSVFFSRSRSPRQLLSSRQKKTWDRDGATSNYFLSTFGRSPRTSVCACEVSYAPSLSQALHLLNGNTVHGKIKKGGVVPALLEAHGDAEAVIEELYLRCLSRPPTDTERCELGDAVAAVENEREALEDVFWALLNSKEFIFNH